MKIVFSIAFCLIGLISYTQNFAQTVNRQSAQIDFRLPTPTGNNGFFKTVDGVADVNLNYNYPILKNVYIGVGGKMAIMQVNDFKTGLNSVINAKYNAISANGILGYKKQYNDKFYLDYALRIGYAWTTYTSLYNASNTKLQNTHSDLFFEPSIGGYLFANENVAYGMILGYAIKMDQFHYSKYGIPTILPGFQESQFEGITQYFTVGFGVQAYFGKKKH